MQMVEITGAIFSHEKEPRPIKGKLIQHGCDFMTEAFYSRALRLKCKVGLDSLKRKDSGLNHIIHGHMNKHFLKKKWQSQ
jgi:hypothetical protein